MSVNISSRILRSSHSKRLQAIPWEVILHIFSHCDQPTLLAVSLVSFACWELAGPILYERVEIRSVDALISLLFLEDVPPSQRLRSSPTSLSRIRNLILHHESLGQPRPSPSTGSDEETYESDESDLEFQEDLVFSVPPHRLLLFAPLLPLEHLILLDFDELRFTPIPIFKLLSPRTFTFRRVLGGYGFFVCTALPFSTSFLQTGWLALERVALEGMDIYFMKGDGREGSMGLRWARARASEGGREKRRSFELRFDFSAMKRSLLDSLEPSYGVGRPRIVGLLENGGVLKEMLELVDFKVVMRVKRADEGVLRDEMSRDLREWMKAVVVVEAV